MKAKRKRIVITSVIIIIFFGILLYTAGSSFLYYRTPGEVVSDESLHGKSVKVSGKVVGDIVEENEGVYKFMIADEENSVAVVYSGVLPSALKKGAEVIVEGVYEPNSGIKADSLLAKCPSKYTSEE
ncbi:cytochrome c maturation protein CcmE [Candidatus Oleimmundimicrobium sp.]|uniref:cytochrome c maturation protein CcmE n=1 Tax=Candidatus Oleimmundimicrobium sp. TaxID=3060597 RepID=UPI00271637BC|nr:cytochrome c maturation protein CcmE [Candidatus Oleimmundimicrobium sp.]MDO8886881.1 cytochrome c maturation protein CcmE [Candidatus Oleimmundimicrobium sp.]